MKKQFLAAGFGLAILASAFVIPHSEAGKIARSSVNVNDTTPGDTTKPKDTIKINDLTAMNRDTVPGDTSKPKDSVMFAYNAKDTVPGGDTTKPKDSMHFAAHFAGITMLKDTVPGDTTKPDTTKPQFDYNMVAYNR
jgi:hypothetical protein